MKVSRLEGFTDGILVIIFTIMVLEFKVPDSSNIQAIFNQFPYFISYTIGWMFLGEAWYNHLFIVSKIKTVTHKIFLINGIWLFTTSFLPLSTAWIGKNLYARGPEIFYGIVFFIWSLAFLMLVQTVINDNERLGRVKQADELRSMKIYKYLTNPVTLLAQGIAWIAILIVVPQFQLIIMIWQIMFVAAKTNVEVDQKNMHN
ncbi:TMEM175 family protein [Lactobacillaceae bacterium Melli_B4]